jgi:hypothetical protein
VDALDKPVLLLAAGVAMVAGLLLVMALVQAEHRRQGMIAASMLWVVGVFPLTSALLARNPLFVTLPGETPEGTTAAFVWSGRLLNALFFLTALAALWWWLTQAPRPRSSRARFAWLAGLAMSGAFVLSGLLGTVHQLDYRVIGWPVAVTIIYLVGGSDLDWMVAQLHRILLVTIVGSLISWMVAPNWADQSTLYLATGSFADRSLRLQGLLSHPNDLGAAALFAFLLGMWRREMRFRYLACGLSLLALVLSGSRTPLLALPVCAAVLVYYRSLDGRRPDRHVSTARLGWLTVFAGVGLILILALSAKGLVTSTNGYVQGIATAQGRAQVWSVTLQQWRHDPLVGYGPTLWSPQFRAAQGLTDLSYAGQAHNQFIDALGGAGLVGLTALLAFCFGIARIGWRRCDSGLTLALGLATLFVMSTESMLQLGDLPPALVPGLVVFVVAILADHRASAPTSGAARARPAMEAEP